jgi:hypothetical protein
MNEAYFFDWWNAVSGTVAIYRDLYYSLSYRTREGPDICYRITANRGSVFLTA